MFAENSVKDKFNNEALMKLNYPLIEVSSLDKNVPFIRHSKLPIVANYSQSQICGLAKVFRFKMNIKVMPLLTKNRTL